MERKLNFAILGAGHIAEKMAKTIDYLRLEINPYAVASRDKARAERICAVGNFQVAYGSYDEMLNDPEVDIVYIATPNSLHYEQAKASLLAGKHVICEKPFTLTSEDAEDLFMLARERNLFIMEAVWTRFHPVVKTVREIIASGEIGEPRFIQAAFALAIDHKERMTSPALGGGALLDLGIYPLTFTDLYFGLDYKKLTSHATITESGVDDQSTITIEYPDGRMASLMTSMTAAYGTTARIACTKGSIDCPNLTWMNSLTIRKPNTEDRTILTPFEFNGYEYEIRAAIKAINNGDLECEECSWDDTLRITRLMEQLLNEWR